MIGYICKNCAAPAPTGVGYTVHTGDAAEASLAALEFGSCGCGHSVAPTPDRGDKTLALTYIDKARIAHRNAADAAHNAEDYALGADAAPTVERSAPAAARARRVAQAADVQYGLVKVYAEAAQRLDPKRWGAYANSLVDAADTSAYLASNSAADAARIVLEDRRAGRREGRI